MNVLIILKTIFLHIKNLFYLGFGTECVSQKTLVLYLMFFTKKFCRRNPKEFNNDLITNLDFSSNQYIALVRSFKTCYKLYHALFFQCKHPIHNKKQSNGKVFRNITGIFLTSKTVLLTSLHAILNSSMLQYPKWRYSTAIPVALSYTCLKLYFAYQNLGYALSPVSQDKQYPRDVPRNKCSKNMGVLL